MITVDRIDYYGQQAVEAFRAAHQEGVGTGRLGVSGSRSGAGHGRPGAGVQCPWSALRPSTPY
ncbi:MULTISPECIES: hypothetical protein [Streptomyces]|uniref:hypothetical protein n=1 Tax=Streptomyces TaxID=1883 RepID=UPI000BE42FFA